ncbi:MAG: hypothetical protein CSB15_00790 [Clostridiales bacterium]|nr:MAG: hypothetical protein CSB15_00790 [Clostridiales bacterium]
MSLSLAFKFARKNIYANKLKIMAFVLSSSIMLSLLQIFMNISFSDYVKKKHAFGLLSFYGIFVIGLFTFIFILYSNSYIIKGRNKELALYGILGLEKKHIRKIVFFESFICFFLIVFLTSVLGFVFGKLMFLAVTKILKDSVMDMSTYKYLPMVFIITTMFVGLTFIIIHIYNIINIRFSLPIELINKSKRAEKEPKIKWFITLLGVVLLSIGYYIAITTEGNIKSLGMFFVAAMIVMVATYHLYVGLSIFILKTFRKSNSYYKKDKFIFISGMLYRMKKNATGLASVCIMLTGLIITMSASITIYNVIYKTDEVGIYRDFRLEWYSKKQISDNILENKIEAEKAISSILNKDEKIKNLMVNPIVFTRVRRNENELFNVSAAKDVDDFCYIQVETLDAYNKAFGKNVSLNEDEVMISQNNSRIKIKDDIKNGNFKIAGKSYKVKNLDVLPDSRIGVETYKIIVPNIEILKEISKYYKIHKFNDFRVQVHFDVENLGKDFKDRANKKIGYYKCIIDSKKDVMDSLIQAYGGILFTGIVVTILFLSGTVLVIYYKQVSEGYEDRKNYSIMKNVGLDNNLIKKSTSKQVLWLFLLPLITAFIHSFVASKIVYQLLCIFSIGAYSVYFKNLVMITIIIGLVYYIIFKITSNIYYKIVISK